MPSSTEAWGIEVGSYAIKAVHLQKAGTKAGAQAVLVEHEVIPHKKVLSTPDTDIEEAIRVGLSTFAAKHPINNASVSISVPGTMAFARFAKLPPVEPKRVPDIVKFEAIQQIPFPIDQVEWDYQVFAQPDSPDVEVGIFAITKERVMAWLSHFEAAGIPVHGVTLSPVAVYNALAYDLQLSPESPGVMLIDIGTLSTDLIIAEEGRVWLRTLPIGGHQFTEAIARTFKLPYSKAEKIKKEAATSKHARSIFQAMRPVFVDLVGEVQKSLGYYQSLNRDSAVKSIVGMGSTFKLPGLQKFIKQQLQIDVHRLDSFKRLEAGGKDAANFAENVPTLAPAVGLAIQGLEMEKVSANVLPSSIVRASIWKNKNRWIVAAAAVLAVSAVVPLTKLYAARSAYTAAASANSGTIKSAISKAESLKSDWEKAKGDDPRKQIDNFRTLGDMADIWPMILLDIQKALQTVKTQPVLYGDSVEEIQKIKRQDRRFVRVKSISTRFFPNGEVGSATGGAGPMMNPGPGGPAGNRGGASGGGEGAAAQAKNPIIEVTVVGTTPFHEGKGREGTDRFINGTLTEWFNKQANKSRRPYKIVTPIAQVPVVQDPEAKTTEAPGGGAGLGGNYRGGQSGPRFPTPGTQPGVPPRPQPGVRPLPGTVGQAGVNNPPGVGVPSAAEGPQESTDPFSYFPTRPLMDEKDRSNDMQFTLVFQVELLPPEEVRKIKTDKEYIAYLNKDQKVEEGKDKDKDAKEGNEAGGDKAAGGDEKKAEGESREGDKTRPDAGVKPEEKKAAPVGDQKAGEAKPAADTPKGTPGATKPGAGSGGAKPAEPAKPAGAPPKPEEKPAAPPGSAPGTDSKAPPAAAPKTEVPK